ncbi:AI-2E family transporter [Sulfurovum sp. zt1-1]|uniref:AI-2E family transporter n=1 Tax=Sulfurovum zhangzhouensis TaxID=3019067 RepID=A0ABT7QX05_9BACT|nr:AI-2E family transporter [Sulfurovum zhangzhouensis]MDM5271368.1 AI-2E family transporter [Sulfurovum zhangzhouensis]
MITNKSLTITVLFILSLIGAYSIYQPFLLSLVVAMLLTMATYNFTKKLIRHTQSRKLSAAIATLFLVLIIFAPIIYLATNGVGYLSHMDISVINDITSTLRKYEIPYFKDWMSDEKISEYLKTATSYLTTAGSVGIGFVKNMLLVLVFYFIINFYGERFFDLIRALMPVSRMKSAKMIHEVSSTMEVVFYSIIVTAIFEGVLFGVMASYYEFNGLLFGVIYGFASLIPIVGGAVVWVPLSLYAWTNIDGQTAFVIAVYSVIVISIIADTFVKPVIIKVIKEDLLKSTIEINEIVIFFSILAGISTYGFWGMILGPAITSFLIAITKVYIDYNEAEYIKEIKINKIGEKDD